MQHADEIHSAFLNTRSGQKSRGKCDKSQLGHKFRVGEGGLFEFKYEALPTN